MRHERHVARAYPLPSRDTGLKLKPRRPQLEMVRLARPPNTVDAVRNALEQPIVGEPRERARADTGLLSLPARTKTPLPFGDVKQAL